MDPPPVFLSGRQPLRNAAPPEEGNYVESIQKEGIGAMTG